MDTRIVSIKCQGNRTLPIDVLKPFQGQLKDLSHEDFEKLKLEIVRHGFSEPISVWEHEGQFFILNGHQRLRTLTAMRDEGWFVPEIPVSMVNAKNEKEAKELVLALTSQFGRITDDGLYEFSRVAGIDIEYLETLRMPEIDFDKWKECYFDVQSQNIDGAQEIDPNDFKLNHECPKCGFQFND